MKSEWKNSKDYELGEVCSRLSSGKSISAKEILEFGKYPVYGGNGIRGYTDKKNFSGQCGIIGRQGAFCGNVRYFSGEAYMTEHAVVVCANEQNDTRYLVYMLSQLQLGRLSGQSAQPGLSVKVLAKQKIHLPDLETQKKIAKVLSALDDKIELNNQINKNLEEQAKSVFDCIYTKAPATYIGNLIETIECGSRPRGGAEKTGIPSIGAEKIERFGVYDFANEKFISEEYYERMTRGKIISGDVLLYKDGAYTGKVSMALDSYPYIKCAVNEHVFIVRTTASMYQSYLYFCLSRQDVRKQVHTLASSKAAQPGLNQNELKSVSICVPDKITLNNFEIQVAPLMHTIAINALQNKRLSEIRDTLLPKLMSGEIDVDNVEI